jgi:putative hydrolase of the HAD superfamily
MKKAVIFDLDNTLVDFVDRKKIVIRETVKAMIDAGLDEDFEALHKDFSEYYWSHGIENQKIFQNYLMHRYKKIDYRILAHAIIAYRKVNSGLLRPYPGARRLLIYLKSQGYKLAILSDAPRLEAYMRLCTVGFDDFFDVILTTDDTKTVKPHSKGFFLAAKKLGVHIKDCIMIGDTPDRDIVGAKKLGMLTIFAEYGAREKTVEADYVAKNIMDVLRIFEKKLCLQRQ